MHIIVANLIALIASLFMVYSGILKNKQEILLTQTIQIGLSITSNIILGGITGTIINALSFIRNILCYKNKLNTYLKVILTLLATILTLKFNNLGIIGLLILLGIKLYVDNKLASYILWLLAIGLVVITVVSIRKKMK